MPHKWVKFLDDEAANMLVALAQEDRRTEGNTVALLIRAEYARRQNERAGMVTRAEALSFLGSAPVIHSGEVGE